MNKRLLSVDAILGFIGLFVGWFCSMTIDAMINTQFVPILVVSMLLPVSSFVIPMGNRCEDCEGCSTAKHFRPTYGNLAVFGTSLRTMELHYLHCFRSRKGKY